MRYALQSFLYGIASVTAVTAIAWICKKIKNKIKNKDKSED